MAPDKTSCAGPTPESPQKPPPQPIRRTLPVEGVAMSASCPFGLALLLEGREAFLCILRAGHHGQHELGIFEGLAHSLVLHGVEAGLAEADRGWRPAGDAGEPAFHGSIEFRRG